MRPVGSGQRRGRAGSRRTRRIGKSISCHGGLAREYLAGRAWAAERKPSPPRRRRNRRGSRPLVWVASFGGGSKQRPPSARRRRAQGRSRHTLWGLFGDG